MGLRRIKRGMCMRDVGTE
ncbi:hypothetical protein CJF30_00004438 [Rutstroemia sp. NJR-2017a BBW]|nr:hypothetical protein CJF30_00004438 [Rutstroemia sp. NJR-2017a BBW]